MPVLTRDDCERLHAATLDLLEDPGVKLEHDEICRRMVAAGAKEGAGAHVMRIPRKMVAEQLAKAPSVARFADRRGNVVELAPKGRSVFWTGAAHAILDEGGCRQIETKDLAAVARLSDRLDNVHAVVGTSMADQPPKVCDFVGLRVMAEATRKHLRALCFTPIGAEAMAEMGIVLAGGASLKERPVFSMGFTAHGPLRWTNLALDIFYRSAGRGIPVTVNGEPLAGASAPVTLAGAVAVGNAEILAGIVANQVIEPGRPCLHNLGFAHVMDMRTGIAVTGGPENALLASCGAALAAFYGLPSASWMCTDSMVPDHQAVAEKMMGAVTHLTAGVNAIWGMGQLESEKTLSLVQEVLDDEIAGCAYRFARGVPVNEASIALDEIRAAGIEGDYLARDHTLEHYRSEIHQPRLLCRVRRGKWEADGARDLLRRAQDRLAQLQAEPVEETMDGHARAELARIEKQYRDRLLG